MRSLRIAAALMAATPLLLAGCGDNNDADPTATLPVQSTLTSAATATPGAERSPTAATSPTTAATPTTASVSPCTDDLELSTAPAGAAAGTHFAALIVTNVGQQPCTVFGFPGVSLLDTSGAQVGPAAERNTAFQPATVLLAPGEKANATAGFPNWQNFDAGVCPTESTSVRLYPPDNLDSLIVPFGDHACPGFSVKPFEAGIGDAQQQ